jgi:hypothetical protein
MRAILLSAVAAVALCGAAVAQGQSSGGGAAQQPPIMKTPSGPGANGQRQGGTGAEGGGAAVQEQPNRQPARQDARQPSQEGESTRQGATQRRQQTDQGTRRDATQQRDQRQPARDTAQGKRDENSQRPRQQEQAGEQNRQNRPTASGNVSSRTRINISSPQQKTVIKNNIVRTSVRVPAGVTIAVGSVLPRTLTFHPVPAAVIAVIPELEPYYYIVIDGQVVFVDPGTFEIVYIMSLA